MKRTVGIEARIQTDFEVEYWYEKDQEMPESEVEHVRECLEDGYRSGELNDSNENRGWWKTIHES